MSSSERKDSIGSAETLANPIGQSSCCRQPGTDRPVYYSRWSTGAPYPPTEPFRRAFLAARFMTIICCLVLFPLSFIAELVINRAQWQTPMLTPTIWVACLSGWDVYVILRCGRRSLPLMRLFYDGMLGVGLAISTGFLVHFTLGDLTGTAAGASTTTAGIAGATLFLMFSDTLVQLGIACNGLLEWLEYRRWSRDVHPV